jgi:predicted choloylglycine hydrolase
MIAVESTGSIRDHGRALGESIRPRRDELEAAAWRTISEEYALSREFALAEAERLTQALREHAPEAHEELRGVAEGAGWPIETASVYNHWNYIVQQSSLGKYVPGTRGTPVAEECTARLALGEITATGQPIMAKNKDYAYLWGADKHCVHTARSAEGYSFLSYGIQGWVGCDNGVNETGLCIVLTWVGTPDRGIGVQSHILTKLVLRRCATTAEALEYLGGIPRTGMCNWVMVDAEGDAALFENAHSRHGIRRAEEGMLVCANHFTTAAMRPHNPPLEEAFWHRYISTRTRHNRAVTLLSEAAPKVTAQTMLDMSADHDNGPSALSICAHGEVNGDDSGSVGAFVYDAAARTVHVIDGRPCEARESTTFRFPA